MTMLMRYDRQAPSRAFGNIFDELFDWPSASNTIRSARRDYVIDEDDIGTNIYVALPGVKHDEIDVSCTGNILSVALRRDEGGDRVFTRSDQIYRWSLDDTHDASSITARSNDGVLTLTIPRVKEETIAIDVETG